MFNEDDVIFSYTRAQAIADGVLVDVSELAKEAGFRFPVAMTCSVWAKFVEVPKGVTGQDEQGRLWDIFSMLRFAIKTNPGGESVLLFQVLVRNDNKRPRKVVLKSVCGPGDDAEPVITVMLPEED